MTEQEVHKLIQGALSQAHVPSTLRTDEEVDAAIEAGKIRFSPFESAAAGLTPEETKDLTISGRVVLSVRYLDGVATRNRIPLEQVYIYGDPVFGAKD